MCHLKVNFFIRSLEKCIFLSVHLLIEDIWQFI